MRFPEHGAAKVGGDAPLLMLQPAIEKVFL